jgi:protein phosphatase
LSKAPVRYAVAAISDCGNKRPSNEDAFGYSAEHGVYIVCDGMGGAAAGEIASSQAVNEVLRLLSDRAGKEDARLEDLVAEAIFAANQAIYSHAQQDANLGGMGTTLVGLVTDGTRILVFNVGDSRCYRMRLAKPSPAKAEDEPGGTEPESLEQPVPEEKPLMQVSQDHSLVAEQVRMGRMTHDEALHSNYRNVITRALGTQPTVQPDIFELEAEAGDTFLLCSDGLTGEISDEQIESMLAADLPLEQLCASLVDAAKQAGGHDNITCMLVRVELVS